MIEIGTALLQPLAKGAAAPVLSGVSSGVPGDFALTLADFLDSTDMAAAPALIALPAPVSRQDAAANGNFVPDDDERDDPVLAWTTSIVSPVTASAPSLPVAAASLREAKPAQPSVVTTPLAASTMPTVTTVPPGDATAPSRTVDGRAPNRSPSFASRPANPLPQSPATTLPDRQPAAPAVAILPVPAPSGVGIAATRLSRAALTFTTPVLVPAGSVPAAQPTPTPIQAGATPVQPTALPFQPTATPIQPTTIPIQLNAAPTAPSPPATPTIGAASLRTVLNRSVLSDLPPPPTTPTISPRLPKPSAAGLMPANEPVIGLATTPEPVIDEGVPVVPHDAVRPFWRFSGAEPSVIPINRPSVVIDQNAPRGADVAPGTSPVVLANVLVADVPTTDVPAADVPAKVSADVVPISKPTPIDPARPPLDRTTVKEPSTVRLSAPPAATPAADPAIIVSPAIQLASRAFASAIAAAVRPRAPQDDRQDPLGTIGIVSADTGTVDRRIILAATDTRHPALDLRQEQGLQGVIDRIETLRDDANARDTRIRLVPDALGGVDIALRKDGDTLHVRFAADNRTTAGLLAEAQPRLAELAEARGVKLGQTSVTSGDGQPPRQQQQQSPTQPARPATAARAAIITDTPDLRPDLRIA